MALKTPLNRNPAGAFDALMNAAVDAIVIIDDRGGILRFNPAAEKMFGYPESEVTGQNVSRLMPEPHRQRHDGYLEHYRETQKAAIIGVGREVEGRKSDGSTFPMFLSVGEIRHEAGSRFVGIIHDLSEVRRSREQVRDLEEQLLHADRLVTLGELMAGIAHEINQPLTAIAAYADAGRNLIARGADVRMEDLETICGRIAEQSRRAAEVVQRLRKLVRSGSVSKARHEIDQIIKNILLLFDFELKRAKADLIYVPSEQVQELYVDEIHIQQIIVNLVKNSLDAIVLAGQPDGRIEIRVDRSATDILISVTDNGPGVAQQHRGSLFEPFFTTKPAGVGLGLSICRNIAEAHGGSLRHSEPGDGGSRFTLLLPLEYIG
jgi:two-component system sensor kinase FixL